MMNENAVKKATYCSFEVFFHNFVNLGEGHLGYYPPGGSSVMDVMQDVEFRVNFCAEPD